MSIDEQISNETRIVMDCLELMSEVYHLSEKRFCLIGRDQSLILFDLREKARSNPEMDKHFSIMDHFKYLACGLNPTPNMLFFDTEEHLKGMDQAIHQVMGVEGCSWEQAVEKITADQRMNCTKISKGGPDEPTTIH